MRHDRLYILLGLCKGHPTCRHLFLLVIGLYVSSVNPDFLSFGISWCFLSSVITVFFVSLDCLGSKCF